MSCLGYSVACSANVEIGEAPEQKHGHKVGPVSDKTAKKKAKSKAGGGRNQRAVQKAKLGQDTLKRVSRNQSVTEEKPMKKSNFSKNLSKVRNWATSAVIAIALANSSSPVL